MTSYNSNDVIVPIYSGTSRWLGRKIARAALQLMALIREPQSIVENFLFHIVTVHGELLKKTRVCWQTILQSGHSSSMVASPPA